MSDIAGGNLYFVFHILLFLQAACHKERHVSQKAVSFIHDVLTEVLTSWAELPHFHFNEALFRPFEHIMQLELCDEDVQDQVNLDSPEIKVSRFICIIQQITHTSIWLQVVTSIGELVEMCSPQILSGWRPLFSALRTVHSSKTDTKDYLLGEYSMGTWSKPVHAFLNKTTFVSTPSSFPPTPPPHSLLQGSPRLQCSMCLRLSSTLTTSRFLPMRPPTTSCVS